MFRPDLEEQKHKLMLSLAQIVDFHRVGCDPERFLTRLGQGHRAYGVQKQHFAAVQYGYQNESLRNERKRLLEENQRLSLEKERVMAPDKLAPAALRLGLKPARPGQIGSNPR